MGLGDFFRTFQVLLTGLRLFAVVKYLVVLPSYVCFRNKKSSCSNGCLCDISSSASSCTYQDCECEFDIFGHCDNVGSAMCSKATISQQCRTLAVNSCRQNASAIMWKIRALSAGYMSSEEGITHFCIFFSSQADFLAELTVSPPLRRYVCYLL